MSLDLAGKNALITGPTSGLGWESAQRLRDRGAHIYMLARNVEKATPLRDQLASSGGKATIIRCDTSMPESVTEASAQVKDLMERVDILILNAGMVDRPPRKTTANGTELTFATNTMGHFQLTHSLIPQLRGARVVWVCSLSASWGRINLNDLNMEKGWNLWAAYANSKAANIALFQELARRSDEAGWGITSVGAHPGLSKTNAGSKNGKAPRTYNVLMDLGHALKLTLTCAEGARPILYAATADVQQGGYYGPKRALHGDPGPAKIVKAAMNPTINAALWEALEQRLI